MTGAHRRDHGRRVTRILLATQTVSEAGDFIGLAALLLLAYGSSGSVLGSAAIFAVRLVPAVLLSTVVGSWLERPERRAGLVAFALLGALAVGGVAMRPTFLLALVASAILQGARTASFGLQASVVVDQLPPVRRGPFFASSGVISQSATVLGYVCGAALTTEIGPRIALGLDAATFVIGAALLAQLPRVLPAVHRRRPSPTAGIRTVFREPVLRLVTPVVFVGIVGGLLPETLAPRLAHGAALPVLMASMPFGGLCTSFFAGRLGVLENLRRQLGAAALWGVAFAGGAVALAVHAGWGALAAANAVAGAASVWIIGARTTYSRFTPIEHMAQVETTMVAMIAALTSVGTLALAAIATVSLPLSYALAGVPVLVLAAVLMRPVGEAATSGAAADVAAELS